MPGWRVIKALPMSTPDEIRAKYGLISPFLERNFRRLWLAAEAAAIGRGGITLVASATGHSEAMISAGLRELRGLEPVTRRKPAAKPGRKLIEEKDPLIEADLKKLLEDETAGSPMDGKKWQRSSLRKLSKMLKELGHQVERCTVARLLKKLGYSMRANKKRRSGSQSPERDEQFRYIASQRAAYISLGLPVISVDTKKKELIGNFRNNGRAWCREPYEVNEHDFTSTAECRAIPFGIYDVGRNEGFVVVGISNDTPEFAVNAIGRWWREVGKSEYPESSEILILADCGGTNGYRCRSWKLNVQERLCDGLGRTVTVCHYPPGCSKWNPVEHRLFSQVSINWAGKPLRTLEVMLGYMRGTTTATGLSVQAHLDEEFYRKGQKVGWAEADQLRLEHHDICPDWNYTLRPRKESSDRAPSLES
jgi:Rhodopirellula transposase DDE domain